MESLVIAVLILLGAGIIFMASKLLGKGLKIAARAMLVIILLLSILSFLVFKDLQALKADITAGKSAFLLAEGDKVYTAVSFKQVDGSVFTDESFEYYGKEALDNMSKALSEKKAPPTGANRTFVVTPKMLNKSYELPVAGISQDEMLAIMKSSNLSETIEWIVKAHPEKQLEISSLAYWGESRVKGYLLAALTVNYFRKTPGEFTTHIKSGDLRIYPETISFKILKYLPLPSVKIE